MAFNFFHSHLFLCSVLSLSRPVLYEMWPRYCTISVNIYPYMAQYGTKFNHGTSNNVSNIIIRLIDNRKLLIICILLLLHSVIFFNTLWTGDADLRLYITTVQDGWGKSAFLTRAWFPRTKHLITQYTLNYAIHGAFLRMVPLTDVYTRVGTLKVATIYLQLIQNRYMFRSFTVLHCSHQHCVQPVASDVEVVGYL